MHRRLGIVAVAAAVFATSLVALGGRLDRLLLVDGVVLVVLLGGRRFVALVENAALRRDLEATVDARTAELHEREARFAALVRRSSELVSIVTPDGIVQYQSPSIERALGHSADALLGSDFTRLVHPDDRSRWRAAVAQTSANRHGPVVLEWRVWHTDGSWHVLETTVTNLLDEPSVQGLVLNARDVTERKSLEEQLRHNAFHDPLTGLANRALFRDRLEHALAASARQHRVVAVLFVDLDDFKSINDSNGHDAGDELLVLVAQRMRGVLRSSDTIARLGGDEFALLIEQADGEVEAVRAAKRILEALAAPFSTNYGPAVAQASIGIATGLAAEDAEELMRNADVALYVAKGAGKNRYEVFRPQMHEALMGKLQMESDLRAAVERQEFVAHYQPIVDIATGDIEAVEALIRWNHPTRGMVSPGSFIPVAEDTGLIVPIGAQLLEAACADVVGWRVNGVPVSLSVNLSARQLAEDDLVPSIREALASTSFEPARLTLEITESMLLENTDVVITRLEELKSMGVRLSIDDFGTGYSSLAYLQRLPVDELKIDRSFVAGLPSEPKDIGVIKTIVSLAQQFGLDIVGEGVESPAQLAALRGLGCTHAQGFYLARPMPASEAVARLGLEGTMVPATAPNATGPQ